MKIISILIFLFTPSLLFADPFSSKLNLDGPYTVTQVIDGDTIEVQTENGLRKIRMIGIDTPETRDPRKPIQCYGPEASVQAKKTLKNKVYLEKDYSQGDKGKYGRLIRYVYTLDMKDFGLEMIQGGFAREYTYRKAYQHQGKYREAEKLAKAEKVGLWSACEQKQVQRITQSKANAIVKKSRSGICHDNSSRWYRRTKNFSPFQTVQECLESGGRLPKK